MPPKPKFTKEEITIAAVNLVREKGENALTARELGARLGTTARPIFTAFKNMDEGKEAVMKKTDEIFFAYREEEIKKNNKPRYKAIGTAYIRFAAEEKNLFKLKFMRDRTENPSLLGHEFDTDAISTIEMQTGFSEETSNMFHTEMWLFAHGIATTLVSSYLDWSPEQISNLLADAYKSFKWLYENKKESEITEEK